MRLIVQSLVMFLVGCLPAVAAQAEGARILPEHHPWGRFRPGAWKQVRVVTEALDDKGLVKDTSTTETTTSLCQIAEDGVTLDMDVVQEVAGKRFVVGPTTVKQGFDGELVCEETKTKDLGTGEVAVAGRKVPCRIIQIECLGPNSRTVTKISYSSTVAPYILKRESVTTDREGKAKLGQTTISVVGLGRPFTVRGMRMTAFDIEAVQRQSKGTTRTWAVTSPDVPGGIINNRTEEVDQKGRLIRRGNLELVAYGLDPEPERQGFFGRPRRGHRGNLGPRYSPW